MLRLHRKLNQNCIALHLKLMSNTTVICNCSKEKKYDLQLLKKYASFEHSCHSYILVQLPTPKFFPPMQRNKAYGNEQENSIFSTIRTDVFFPILQTCVAKN